MSAITKELIYEDYKVVVGRSRVKDALRRELIVSELMTHCKSDLERSYASAAGRLFTQTVTSSGLGFDASNVTNLSEAFEALKELDETFIDQWFDLTHEINKPIKPEHAPGVDVDSLKKKKTE